MKLKDARIIFMGTSFFAKEILKNLTDNKLKINLVVTQPDKLAGRKKKLKASEVKIFAEKKSLNLLQFNKLDQSALNKIKKSQPDLIIVASYGMIIPDSFLEEFPDIFINIHTSLLPKLRGASPVQTALLQEAKKTGVTIMKIDSKLDAGDIILQKEVLLDPNDTHPTLEKKLINASNRILIETLENYLNKKITPRPQNHKEATFTKIIKKKDGQINWNSEAKNIYNKFKAYYKWPQIYTFWKRSGQVKKITLTEIELGREKSNNKEMGEVYQNKNNILIKAKKGSLLIKKIKLEGKKELAIENFLNGYPDFLGTILK
jgi:methionyl-tRNA formyltransferase